MIGKLPGVFSGAEQHQLEPLLWVKLICFHGVFRRDWGSVAQTTRKRAPILPTIFRKKKNIVLNGFTSVCS